MCIYVQLLLQEEIYSFSILQFLPLLLLQSYRQSPLKPTCDTLPPHDRQPLLIRAHPMVLRTYLPNYLSHITTTSRERLAVTFLFNLNRRQPQTHPVPRHTWDTASNKFKPNYGRWFSSKTITKKKSFQS